MNEASSTEETKNTCMCRSIKVAMFSGCDFVFVPFHLILHVSVPFHPHLVFNLFHLVLVSIPFHNCYRAAAKGYELFRIRYPGLVHYFHTRAGMWGDKKKTR